MHTGAATMKRASKIARIEPWCTGCGGSPVCLVYCKQKALKLIRDEKNYPFSVMTVVSSRCIGCGACVAGGKQGIMLNGCPWDAIRIESLL